MQKVYVIGHKNPDTDAVAAPFCYAWLKNAIDKNKEYIPGILGNLNPQTKYIFEALGLNPPELIRDLLPKAEDVMLKDLITILEDDPIGLATQLIDQRKVRTIPVLSQDGDYQGLVTMQELANYFMPKHYEIRPLYNLRPENFCKVLPGKYLKRGSMSETTAPLMVGAMAFDTFIQRLNDSMQSTGAILPVMIVGNRPDIISFSLQQKFPVLILTGMSEGDCNNLDYSNFEGWIYISAVDTAETIRLLRTSIPAKAIADKSLPSVAPWDYLHDVKKTLLSLNHHGVAVVENGKLLGLVTSSCLIDPPKNQVIMVDHNEFNQSAEGIEQADIVEIIDHHRLGSIRTTKPIYVYSRPLGSSCTLIFQHFQMYDIEPTPQIAALLLSGILTDTVILRSPTTTEEDVLAAEVLAKVAGLNLYDWGKNIFSHAASLAIIKPDDAVQTDFKIYQEYGYRVGIAQMEVITLNDLEQYEKSYLEAIERTKQKFALDWAMLMVTDIVSERSILLSSHFPPVSHVLLYHLLEEGVYDLPGVLSRKKQLLPEILRVLESIHRIN